MSIIYTNYVLIFLEKNSKYSFGIDSSYFVSDYLKTGFEVMNWDKSEFANISFNYDIKDKYLNFTEFEIQKKDSLLDFQL